MGSPSLLGGRFREAEFILLMTAIGRKADNNGRLNFHDSRSSLDSACAGLSRKPSVQVTFGIDFYISCQSTFTKLLISLRR